MLLETERLYIRHIAESDWESVRKIWEDINQSEYAQYDVPKNTEAEAVRARIAKWANANSGNEHMFFAVCLIRLSWQRLCQGEPSGSDKIHAKSWN